MLRLEKEARVRKKARAVLNTALRARAIPGRWADAVQCPSDNHSRVWSEVGSFDDLVQLGRQADGDVVRSQTACSGILRSDAPLAGQLQSTPAMAAKLLVVLTDDRVTLLTRTFHTPASRTV
ncbi:hypothetical protein [Prauserella sp. PE36]|uniref:hypothetical protein n=1 Tax=Prauserella sp. PE36 TaxID=1504709 RepID=UPI0013141CC0|nr:hypothetical protein [Prauserella sp. PE36]